MVGNAYEFRSCKYIEPNRTMATRVAGVNGANGQPVSIRGYWSDLQMPPYCTFGVKDALKTTREGRRYRRFPV